MENPASAGFFFARKCPSGERNGVSERGFPCGEGKAFRNSFSRRKRSAPPRRKLLERKKFFPEKRFPFLCQPSGKNGKTFARNQNRRMNFWVKRFRFPRFAGKVHCFLQDFTSCPLTCLAKVVYYGRLGTCNGRGIFRKDFCNTPEHKNAKEPLI